MNETLKHLRELGISPGEMAIALNVSLDDFQQWLCGELRSEIADMIDVGLLMLEMRLSSARLQSDEPTLRIAAA